MTIHDFMIETEKASVAYFRSSGIDSVTFRQCEVVKMNDETLHGLTLAYEGEHAGWTIYFDDLYERYEKGEPLVSLMEEAAFRCAEGMEYEFPAHPDSIDLSFDSVRDRLTVRLVGIRNNMRYMKGRPYIDVGCGLALIAVINSERDIMSEWALAVTDEILHDEIRCSREELLTAALDNTVRMEEPVLASLEECVYSGYVRGLKVRNYLDGADAGPENAAGGPGDADVGPESADGRPEDMRRAFVLTNRSTCFGAAVLFYPGVMEKIAALFEGGYYVLPSSLHEVMIIPDAAEPDVSGMYHTVREANATVVDRCDLLSDNVLHYDPEDCELRIVREEMPGCVRDRRISGKSIA